MSNLNKRPVRRAAAGVLAGTLALTGGALVAGVSPANALPGFDLERLAGADRYGTAAAIADEAFPDGTDTAIIARGDVFADALAANYLAGALGAPVLLTASGSLPDVTADALVSLGVDNVIIVGGTSAVSAAVEAELDEDYAVDRLGGTDRYLTAELIAAATADETGGTVGLFGGLRTAILGSGQVFPDVLAAGPISYAADHPLLISRPTDLPGSTADVIEDLNIQQVVIVGGTAAVSAAVEAEIEELTGNDVIRVFGQTRYETATAIAELAYDEFGFDDSQVILARGDDFADALAGGPLGGELEIPIVLTAPTALSPATEDFLEDNSDTLEGGYILGGTAAVSNAVEADAEDAAQGEAPVPTTNQTFTVASTPEGAVTQTLANDGGANVATDDRTYTVSGLEAGVQYRVTLVNGDSVRVADNGTVTFLSSADADSLTGFSVDTGYTTQGGAGDVADILSINGAPPTGTGTPNAGVVTPVAGVVTFTIDGTAVGSVVPVIYKVGTAGTGTATTGGTSLRLETTATAAGQYATPAEQFGIGGRTTYVPAEATLLAPASATDGEVVSVDTAANTYTIDSDANGSADLLLRYGVAGDTYRYESGTVDTAVTEAQFETFLSAGDSVRLMGSYNPGANQFVIDNDIPNAPTGLTGTRNAAGSIVLNWTAPANLDLRATDRYRVSISTQASNGTFPEYEAIGFSNTTSFTLANAPVGTHRFVVEAFNAAGDDSENSNFTEVVVPVGADTRAPFVDATVISVDNSPAGPAEDVIGAGDQINVVFSEAVTLAADAQLHFLDEDGTVAAIQRGVNATFTQNAARTSLFISVTAAPILLEAGNDEAGRELTLASDGALVVVNSVGVVDVAANQLAEVNVASITANSTTNVVVVTFNSPVDPTSITAADLTVTNSRVVGTPTANDANTVFTFPVTGLLAADVATLRVNAAVGAFGGNGPAVAATATAAGVE